MDSDRFFRKHPLKIGVLFHKTLCFSAPAWYDSHSTLPPTQAGLRSVSGGQAVKKGDVLMVLEAMKMENEIMCPRDGVVASVNTSKGASVESGTLLCVLQ